MELAAAMIYRLPEECVAHAISMTTPEDACHSSAVSPVFRAAADSDAVWDRFLPPDHAVVLARADRDDHDHQSAGDGGRESKKQLFTRLCSRPVLLDGGTMSLGLERRSGAKCVMLSARALSIACGDDPSCWKWTTCTAGDLPGRSRFAEVAELVDVCWLEITGKLQLSLLSPRTTYAAYLVFSIADDSYGLECNVGMLPPKAAVTVISGSTSTSSGSTPSSSSEHTICLHHMQGEEETAAHRRRQEYVRPSRRSTAKVVTREADFDIRCPRRRGDGWKEVELGQFVADAGEESAADQGAVVEVSFREVDCRRWKRGLVVQGIEMRPTTRTSTVSTTVLASQLIN